MRKNFSLQLNKDKIDDLVKKINEENKEVIKVTPSKSHFARSMSSFLRNPYGKFSLFLLALIVMIIIVSVFICPYSYKEIIEVNGVKDYTAKNLLPFQYSELELSAIERGEKIFPHIFGTDTVCRDYFSRVTVGTIISISIGILASTLVMIIGTIYGAISGFIGGKVDMIMMRIVDVIYSLPDMLIIILLSVLFRASIPITAKGFFGTIGTNVFSLFIVFALLYWTAMARTVRGQILSLREKDYIVALKIMNADNKRIIFKHIIPNCLSVIFISLTLEIPTAIFTESYLSFVGLGVEEPLSSLGSLANDALADINSYPYKLLFPSIMVILIVLAFNIFGNALRDAFDPKTK